MKLLDVDLVILNEHGATYADSLQEVLETVVRTSQSGPGQEGRGRVYILRGDQVPAEDRTMLLTAARAVLLSRRGSLADQVIRLERPERRGDVTCRRDPTPTPAPLNAAAPARAGVLQRPRAVSPTAVASTSRPSVRASRRRRHG